MRGGGDLELVPQGFRGRYSEGAFQKESGLLLEAKTGLFQQKSRYAKFAFTLAEVLITLGIIGVVAALTIPTVISKYREKAFLTQLKKSSAIVETMLVNINAETGSIPDTFRECLDLVGGGSSEPYKCLANMIIKYAPLNPDSVTYKEYNYNRDKDKVGHAFFCHRLYLPDGSVIALHLINNGYVMFGFDVNGDKGPNKPGIDLFQSHYYPYVGNDTGFKSLFKALVFKEKDRPSVIANCKGTETQDGHPQSCMQLIYNNGFEKPKDYPLRF